MGAASTLELISKQQDSVSGFMILSMYAQAPWSFIPQFISFSEYVSDLLFKLFQSTLADYIIQILITGFCWFLNGVLIRSLIEIFKSIKRKNKM